jgi:hypothetical protein
MEVTILNERVYWWLVLSSITDLRSTASKILKRSGLHGFNLCAFASLREILV